MLITKVSPFYGKENTLDINITEEQLQEYLSSDKPIQNVLPFLSAEHREFLMTGITPDEWNRMFKEEE